MKVGGTYFTLISQPTMLFYLDFTAHHGEVLAGILQEEPDHVPRLSHQASAPVHFRIDYYRELKIKKMTWRVAVYSSL